MRRQLARLGNWRRYFRHHGLTAAIHLLTDRCIYRSYRCVVFGGDLARPPAADHIGDGVFRLATASDLDHLGELERYGRGSTQRAHVKEDDDWLFVACQGDRIVATRRLSRAVRDVLVSRVVQLRPEQVWTADNFCLPEYRNQGIGRHLGLRRSSLGVA